MSSLRKSEKTGPEVFKQFSQTHTDIKDLELLFLLAYIQNSFLHIPHSISVILISGVTKAYVYICIPAKKNLKLKHELKRIQVLAKRLLLLC